MAESLASYAAIGFYGAIIILAVAEFFLPARQPSRLVAWRWTTNISLYIFRLIIERILVPVSAFVVAQNAVASETGLFQHWALPTIGAVVLGVLVLDLWKYAEHRIMHAVPFLWRLHLVHHSDVEVDFTTTERHHPLAALASIPGLIGVCYIFGIPPLALAIYILAVAPVSVLSHANICLNSRVDNIISWFVVTPAFHAVHHSVKPEETNSNYGVLLTVWDRIFGSFIPSWSTGVRDPLLGLEYFRDEHWARLDRTLWMPFATPGRGAEGTRSGSENPSLLPR